MNTTTMNYTTRSQVENFAGRVFSDVSDTQFNAYMLSAEQFINNDLGYNSATTSSGIMAESIVREKNPGKVDDYGNLVIDVRKAPVNFDVNGNPIVTLVEYNFGGVRVPLQTTDGKTNALNTILEVSENRQKIYYPSIYFLPYLPSVTPTRKTNLYALRDVMFWVDISYVGGYTIVPSDITMAANYLTLSYLTQRDNPNNAFSIKQGQYQVQFQSNNPRFTKGQPVNQMYDIVDRLLQPYRRVTW